ncbi:unnamed protein product [Blepharisma stoltei]|uniref:Choline kinase n=1 Tax=Blepharisma stoltei TaxID=1481888 RepID=A0AAU9IPH9_9CILI|nr:unnamed protein product [Blepharisma stoltei]
MDIDYIISLCQQTVPSWSNVQKESCSLKRLVGNSNTVCVVETSLDVHPRRIIYRIFGNGETLNLQQTSTIFKRLSETGIAPKIYLELEHARLEEFIDGSRNLQREEFYQPHIIQLISQKLREFHAQDLCDIVNNEDLVHMSLARKWRDLSIINLQKYRNSEREEDIKEAIESLDEKYLDMYRNIQPIGSPEVFAHMDTSTLNFLYVEDADAIVIIDYDYSGYSYRGYDIALLLEDVVYDYNYSEWPYYLYNRDMEASDEIIAQYVKAYGEGPEMFIEVKKCMICTHYFWAVWAFSLYYENSPTMDMLKYGLSRFHDFLSRYSEFNEDLSSGALQLTIDKLFSQV